MICLSVGLWLSVGLSSCLHYTKAFPHLQALFLLDGSPTNRFSEPRRTRSLTSLVDGELSAGLYLKTCKTFVQDCHGGFFGKRCLTL